MEAVMLSSRCTPTGFGESPKSPMSQKVSQDCHTSTGNPAKGVTHRSQIPIQSEDDEGRAGLHPPDPLATNYSAAAR